MRKLSAALSKQFTAKQQHLKEEMEASSDHTLSSESTMDGTDVITEERRSESEFKPQRSSSPTSFFRGSRSKHLVDEVDDEEDDQQKATSSALISSQPRLQKHASLMDNIKTTNQTAVSSPTMPSGDDGANSLSSAFKKLKARRKNLSFSKFSENVSSIFPYCHYNCNPAKKHQSNG